MNVYPGDHIGRIDRELEVDPLSGQLPGLIYRAMTLAGAAFAAAAFSKAFVRKTGL